MSMSKNIDPDEIGYVYLTHLGEDYYKIGWAKDIKDRVHRIESFNPWTKVVCLLTLPYLFVRGVEEKLHLHFAQNNFRREIFRFDNIELVIKEMNRLRDEILERA